MVQILTCPQIDLLSLSPCHGVGMGLMVDWTPHVDYADKPMNSLIDWAPLWATGILPLVTCGILMEGAMKASGDIW